MNFVRTFTSQIDQFIRQLADQRMNAAGAAGAEEARRVVPVLSGHLKSTIGYVYRTDTMTLTIYADAEYALPVEMGHVTAAGNHVPAQPFLRPGAMVAAKALAGRGTVAIATPNAPGGFGAFE